MESRKKMEKIFKSTKELSAFYQTEEGEKIMGESHLLFYPQNGRVEMNCPADCDLLGRGCDEAANAHPNCGWVPMTLISSL